MMEIKKAVFNTIGKVYGRIDPKGWCALRYRLLMGKKLDWNNPKDINEKIQWLQYNSDTTEWSRLADKYRVREYIKECGLESMLVPLYGKWDKAEDIDWDSLPNKFVMKANNGCGDVLICKDKNELDIVSETKKFQSLLAMKFGRVSAQPHYLRIEPCVIAEELLDIKTQPNESKSLIDYKIWCFDGEPHCILVCSDRNAETLLRAIYDLDWNYRPECTTYNEHFVRPNEPMPKPKSLDQMLKAASILSKGFPEVRVDFYDINGKPYFGEMTFTAATGTMSNYSQDFLNELGSKVDLSKAKPLNH